MNRVRQLVYRGFPPTFDTDGRHHFRRHQVEDIANAREAREVARGVNRPEETSSEHERIGTTYRESGYAR
jgi:hypothetical protein